MRNSWRLAAAAGVTLTLGRAHAAAPQPTMITRTIPKSGEALPVVGLSSYRSFSIGGGGEVRSSRREVLRSLFSHGGKMIDSSPLYGRAEEVLGALISDLEAEGQAFPEFQNRRRRPRPSSSAGRANHALSANRTPRFDASSGYVELAKPFSDAAIVEGKWPHQVSGRHPSLSRWSRTDDNRIGNRLISYNSPIRSRTRRPKSESCHSRRTKVSR